MLRDSARRISRAEFNARISGAPRFIEEAVSEVELDRICAEYTAITGVRFTSTRKRNLVAAAYRSLGPEFLPSVKDRFAETGTETNLLADLRTGLSASVAARDPNQPTTSSAHGHPGLSALRRTPEIASRQVGAGVTGAEPRSQCRCAEMDLLPGLIYCAAHRPPFDGRSRRRYDRRRSNPDAARFFTDEELAGRAPEPPRAEALGQ
ncbi:MAG TPA: hypothetical protein VIM30_02640 [Candidatus Limnocylindrales bacterium]